MLSIERLYSVSGDLLKASRKTNVEGAFKSCFPDDNFAQSLNLMLGMIQDASTEVEACRFAREEKQLRYLIALQNFRTRMLEQMILRDRGTGGPFLNEGDVERLGAISDAVTEHINQEVLVLDRGGFASATQDLINEVNAWDMDDFAKRSLLLSLSLIANQATATETSVSDAQIRRRIKALVAEFAVEFSILDKEFETWFEALKRWARLGYNGSPAALGITKEVVKLIAKQ